jgi:delta(3,5)-delta(2,4)-dienoyl-CoA isomerase
LVACDDDDGWSRERERECLLTDWKQGLKLAQLIASKSPVAVLGTKEILNYSRDRTVADGLHYTAVWNAAMLQTDDVKEAMLSGKQKRKVTFSKL